MEHPLTLALAPALPADRGGGPAPDAKPSSKLRAPERWTEFAHLRFTGRDPYKPRINKARTAELIETLGLNGPKVHGVYPRVADIDFAALPSRFVLKPTELSGKRGVMLLRRLNPRRSLAQRVLGRLGLASPAPEPAAYHDAMLDRRLTAAEIVAEQDEWGRLFAEKRHKPLEFIVEDEIRSEWSRESRPREYKVYAFAGELALIVQYSREVSPPRVCFFDGEFRPIHDSDGKVIRGPTIRRGKHIRPKCAAGILDAARRISLALETPFVRVDFYAARGGAVLGELTVVTGGPYRGASYGFSDAFDLEMGRRWTEALNRVGQPMPLYDERWTDERRRTSGLPVKLKHAPRDEGAEDAADPA